MANPKIHVVQDKANGTKTFVYAKSKVKAERFVVGDRFETTVASADDIMEAQKSGTTIHKAEAEEAPVNGQETQ